MYTDSCSLCKIGIYIQIKFEIIWVVENVLFASDQFKITKSGAKFKLFKATWAFLWYKSKIGVTIVNMQW